MKCAKNYEIIKCEKNYKIIKSDGDMILSKKFRQNIESTVRNNKYYNFDWNYMYTGLL